MMLFVNVFCQKTTNVGNTTASMQRGFQPGLVLPDFPLLQLSENSKKIFLPTVVDNSKQPFLRPVFSQKGASCGQAASVGYNFCYEINRLRGLPADTNINQYPDHFVWNFMNAALPYYGEGVSYFHTFDILYDAGTPNEAVYGPITMDDSYYWMSGYDGYYQAIQNRISGANSINVATPEGLNVLKQWLHNHNEGAETGGVANYYAGQAYAAQILPEGTPEAGKHVHLLFGPTASHALTIVGYNDFIRYDLNGDSLFTNNLDINGDSVVDMKDWEIGGLKYVNSYGDNWADSGFCYMLYRTLAIKYGEGGIWNNSVHILCPDTVAKPLLTIKATVSHNKRCRLKFRAGITSDTAEYYPSHTMSFSHFNFQGGDNNMTGNPDPEGKTLEFGLDITPLLSYTSAGKPFRIFLMIDENDPNSSGNGNLHSFSIISYQNQEPIEFVSLDTPMVITNHGQTIASVKVDTPTNPILIQPDSAIFIPVGIDTSFHFSATGGFPPYYWSLKYLFTETESSAPFPVSEGTEIEPNNPQTGFAAIPLPFSFPFCGKKYDTLYMHVNGYLLFDQQDMPYYYLLFDENYLRQVRAIAGYMNKDLGLNATGNYISYRATTDSIIFQWNISDASKKNTTHFTTTLFPDGRIEHQYGAIDQPNTLFPVIGLSDGTRESTYFSHKSGQDPVEGSIIQFTPADIPSEISISPQGLLTIGATNQLYADKIIVQVHDSQRLVAEKNCLITTGLEMKIRFADNENIITPGSVHPLVIELFNHGNDTIDNLFVDVKAVSVNISILGNDQATINILPGQRILLNGNFSVQTADTIETQQLATVKAFASNADFQFNTFMEFQIDVPVIDVSYPTITDGNNLLLEPGEQANLVFRISNYGRASAGQITVNLSLNDPFAGLFGATSLRLDELKGLSVQPALFKISVNSASPLGHILRFDLNILNDDTIVFSKIFEIPVGQASIALVDLDKNHNSSVHIGTALGEISTNFDPLLSINADILNYDILFLSLGFLPKNHPLTTKEDSLMIQFLQRGGRLFLEGGSFFKYDSETMLKRKMCVEGSYDAVYDPADTLDGIVGTPAEGFRFFYNGDQSIGPNLIPLEPAISWIVDKSSGFNFMVALDSVNYRTIASSLEFGGSFPIDGPERPEMIHRYLDFFGYETNPLSANFKADHNVICKESEVRFEPFCGGNPSSFHWTFDGGTPESYDGPNPVIYYQSAGNYGVSLTVSDGVSNNTFALDDFILVEACVGTEEFSTPSIRIFPNPATDLITIETSAITGQKAVVTITDLNGRIVLSKTILAGLKQIQIPMSDLASGCYCITLTDVKSRTSSKLIIF